MLGRAAHRPDERVLAVVLDAHEGHLADLAGLVASCRDDDDRLPGVAERVVLRAAARLVALDLLAHPVPGARLVLTFERHGTTLRSPQPNPYRRRRCRSTASGSAPSGWRTKRSCAPPTRRWPPRASSSPSRSGTTTPSPTTSPGSSGSSAASRRWVASSSRRSCSPRWTARSSDARRSATGSTTSCSTRAATSGTASCRRYRRRGYATEILRQSLEQRPRPRRRPSARHLRRRQRRQRHGHRAGRRRPREHRRERVRHPDPPVLDLAPRTGSVGSRAGGQGRAAPPRGAGGARGRVGHREPRARGSGSWGRTGSGSRRCCACWPGWRSRTRASVRAVAGRDDRRLPAAGARRRSRRDAARLPRPADGRGGGVERRSMPRCTPSATTPSRSWPTARRSSTTSPSAATTSTRARARCSPRSGCRPTGSTSPSATSAAGRPRGPRWPRSCCRSRTCCCSTSRPTTSTSPGSTSSSASWTARRRRSWSCRTTGRSSTAASPAILELRLPAPRRRRARRRVDRLRRARASWPAGSSRRATRSTSPSATGCSSGSRRSASGPSRA